MINDHVWREHTFATGVGTCLEHSRRPRDKGKKRTNKTNNAHLFPLKACIRVLTGANTARVFMSRREAVLSSSPHRARRHLPFFTEPESDTVPTFAGLSLCSPNLLGCGGMQEGVRVVGFGREFLQ